MPDDVPKKESRSLKHWKKMQAGSKKFRKEQSTRINNLQKQKRREMTEEEREIERKKHSTYMKEWRRKKNEKNERIKITPSNSEIALHSTSPRSNLKRKTGFRSKPALLRAVRKLMKEAPASPSKKQGAVSELAKQCGLDVAVTPKSSKDDSGPCSSALTPPASVRSPANIITQEVKSLVSDFFRQTNVVYTAPGLKDEMVHWEAGKKVKLRKYYLELTLKEAYSLFKEQNPSAKIGFSKFAELRPPNVLLMSQAPSDQCRCIHHENFRLKLKPLQVDVDKTFWQKVLCKSDHLSSDCWKGSCSKCSEGQLLLKIIAERNLENDKGVSWHEWVSQEKTTKSGKVVKRTVKELKEGCVAQLKELVETCWPSYLLHVRTKRVMAAEFEKDKAADNVVILQVDFAQDYNTKDNALEVQSAIYGRQNVVIFTGGVYFNGKWSSYAVITDADKYKSTVRVCMLKILRDYISSHDLTEVDKLIIWSDGPSCEFRNKFCTGNLLSELSRVIQRVAWWKYFATAHGKGVCDGVGGSLKARVAEHSKGKHRDGVCVQNYVDFYHLAAKYCPKIKLFMISKEEVESITEQDKPWENTIPLPGVSAVHVAKCGLNGAIESWKLPGEDALKSIKYNLDLSSPGIVPDQPECGPSYIPEQTEELAQTDKSQTDKSQTEEVKIEDRGWYIVQYEVGGKKKKKTAMANYVCQLVGIDGEDLVINSYLKVTSINKDGGLKFKKYPREEMATKSQILKKLQTPEFLADGKVLFTEQLGYSVK